MAKSIYTSIKIDRLLLKQLVDGEANPLFNSEAFAFREDLISEGAEPYSDGTYLYCDMVSMDRINGRSATIAFSVKDLVFVKNDLGGDVFNFAPWVKVAEADIDNEVPEGLPNRIEISYDYTDPDNPVEVQTARTWRTWRDDGHPLSEPIEGFYYFQSNTFYNYLTGTELMIIYNSVNATLVDEVPII